MTFEEGHYEAGTVDGMAMDVSLLEQPDLTNLQMVLVTSSMNHEYTRKAYEKTRSYDKKLELMERMSHLKHLYFTARKKLTECFPDRVNALEAELHHQKQSLLLEETLQ